MARHLVLEWDAQLARLAVADVAGGRVVVEKGITFPFPVPAEGEPASTNAARLDLLSQKITELGWSKLETTICIGRSLLEIRALQVPPVPQDELPDLVRFQATRSFSTLSEDSPIDFIPLADASDGGKILLAAALPTSVLNDVRRLTEKASLRLEHVVCRPFAAAELLPDSFADDKFRLLVDVLGNEADLIVTSGKSVVFPRSVKLVPDEDPATLARGLIAEIRRTLMAARNQLGGGAATEIVLMGSEGQQGKLLKSLVAEFKDSITVKLFDPLSATGVSVRSNDSFTEETSVFAPLLGVLSSKAAGRAPTIDFLNPRKRPEPISYRPLLIKVGIAAAVLFVMMSGYLYWTLSTLDSEIAGLKESLKQIQSRADKGKSILASASKVDEFVAQDVVLLDEMVALSEKFPPASDARLEDLSVIVGAPGNPITAAMQGGATSEQVLSQIEHTLRDSRHTVYGNRAEKKTSIPGFAWTFNAELHINPEDVTGPPASKDAPSEKKADTGPDSAKEKSQSKAEEKGKAEEKKAPSSEKAAPPAKEKEAEAASKEGGKS